MWLRHAYEFHQVMGAMAGGGDGRECVRFKLQESEAGSPAVMGEGTPHWILGGVQTRRVGEEEAGPHMIPLLGAVSGEFRPE